MAYNNRGVIYGYMNNSEKLISDYEKILSFGVDINGITKTGEPKTYYEKLIREAKVKAEADAPETNDKLQTPTILSDEERRRSSVKDSMGFSMSFNALNESVNLEGNAADSKPKDTLPSMVTTPLRDTTIKGGHEDSIL